MANEKVQIDVLIKSVEAAQNVKDLKKALGDLKKVADITGEGSQAFNAYTKAVGESGERIKQFALKAVESSTNVRELRKAIIDLKSAAIEAGEGSQEFIKYNKAAALAADKIDDVNDSINALNPDKKVGAFISLGQSIAGSFAVATGAIGLFGEENEDAQKAILKVQSAVAILSGIQSIADAKREAGLVKQVLLKGADNAQQVISNGLQSSNIIIQKAATVGQWALNAAMSANPIGLIITGITLLTGAYFLFSKATGTTKAEIDKTTESFKRHREELDRINDSANTAAQNQLKLAEAQGADKEIILSKKITAARVAADGIDAQIFSNKINRLNKYNELRRATDDDVIKQIKTEIDESYKSDLKLISDKKNLYNQLTLDITTFNTEKAKKVKESKDKESEEAKKNNEEIKKNNLDLNKQILEIQNEQILNEHQKQLEKLELDAKTRIQELSNIKADAEKKKKLTEEINSKLKNDTAALTKVFDNEDRKNQLDAELLILERDGQSTLKKRIEIAQFERDIILNSTKSTQEEKLKAEADYQKKEKDLLENGIKDLQTTINQNSIQNRVTQLSNFQRKKADLQKAKDDELKVIQEAEKKIIESELANPANKDKDPNQIKLEAHQKFTKEKLEIDKDYANKLRQLQAEELANTVAQYASYVTSALNSIQSLLDSRDDKERTILENKIKENDKQYEIRNKTIANSYDLEIEKARQSGQDTTEIERQKTKAIQQADYEKALSDYNLKKKQDEIAKKQFDRNKKYSAAMAIINTALGITKIYAENSNYYVATAEAILLTAVGVAQLAKINGQSFEGTAGTAPTSPGESASASSSFGGSSNRTGQSVAFNSTTTTNTGNSFRTGNSNSSSTERQAPIEVIIYSSKIAEALRKDEVTIQRSTFG